ncbi:MAG: AAA family ATPase [Planctomyces sp.]|jgi:MoxR-like ATPase|nr:MoxR family ATPase [Planctomyces sp.]GDX92899.1 ATPase AAA [Planctomycetia bacterium]HAV33108.1 AAA family ATPase [Planctomycetaceae bacterium]HBC62539.1 AAA family ATPase [Planctomycetaceae bacterium]
MSADGVLAELQSEADAFRAEYERVREAVGRVIVGQQRVVESVLTAMLCGGNVLLEGVPGLGKTELVKALAGVLKLQFRRIQFTPDLMPADVIGTNIMTTDDMGKYRFEFRQGPIFTQLLLADEINRATPKTQSALLETMQEGTVTTGGTTYRLEQPFFVLATQNPIEQEGTFPLPEAQLDRFMFKVVVPFLNRDELNEVVTRTILKQRYEAVPVLDGARILHLRSVLERVVVSDPMRDYACRLVLATHPDSAFATERVKRFLRFGASPRAAQALIRAARVRALSQGRAHVSFQDVRYFAAEVLQHRALLNYDGQAENVSLRELIDEVIAKLPTEG